jgi:endonuclease YncB( thermonuclease family)
MKKLLLVLLLLPTIAFAQDKTPKGVAYEFKITRIIDGDTVAFEAPFLPDPIKKELSLRVWGVDTPEKGGRAECKKEADMGDAASKFTKDLLAKAKSTKIVIYEWDKFGGRVLGDVLIDGNSLTKMLIEKGFAREYYGDKKTSWCN